MKNSPSCLSHVVLKGPRLLFQLALTIIFLFFFGLPALQRYFAMEVMVVTTTRESGGKIAAPAISINARNPKTRLGWKGDDRELDKLNIDKCLQANNTQTCIENGTYSRNEVFLDVLMGYKKLLSLMNRKKLWQKDITRVTRGSIFTINFPYPVGPDMFNDRLIIEFGDNLLYNIYMHDSKYFVFTSNNAYFPVTKIPVYPNSTKGHYYNFDLIEVPQSTLLQCTPM